MEKNGNAAENTLNCHFFIENYTSQHDKIKTY